MTIIGQAPAAPYAAGTAKLDEIAKNCSEKYDKEAAKEIKNKKKRRTCQKLGQQKHQCCDDEIAEHRKANPPNGKPPLEGENSYRRPSRSNPNAPVNTTPTGLNRGQAIRQAIASAGSGATRAQRGAAIGAALNGTVFPDAAVLDPADPTKKVFVDFKFACPASHRSKKKSTVRNYRPPTQSARQAAAHTALGNATLGGPTVTIRF